MDRETALAMLGLGQGASDSDREQAYAKKRAEMENRLEKAPTEALRTKYARELNTLEEAIATARSSSPGLSHADLSRTMLADLPSASPARTQFGDRSEKDSPQKVDAPSGTAFKPGMVLADRYEVISLIATGGMGAVYKAFDRTRVEEVALKVLLPDLTKRTALQERFFTEAKISSSLSHPNIVNVFDFHKVGDIVFLSMELLEGHTLRAEMIRREQDNESFSVEEVRQVGKALCDALEYAHQFTIHRDIKPENIWFCEDGSVRLMDFGIAQVKTGSEVTQTSAVIGSAYYMAPEQLKGAKNVDQRADQYGVATVLYEMLTGSVPVGRVESVSKRRKDAPEGLSDVLNKALSSNPASRYKSIKDFRRALLLWGRVSRGVVVATAAVFLALLVLATYGLWFDFAHSQWAQWRFSKAFNVGQTALDNKRWDAAREAFNKALRHIQGVWERQPENEAVNGLKRAVDAKFTDIDYWVAMEAARRAEDAGNWEDAIAEYKKALTIKKDDAQALRLLRAAETELRDKLYKEAIMRGDGHKTKREWDKAIRAYEDAMSYKPNDGGKAEGLRREAWKQQLSEEYNRALYTARQAAERGDWETAVAGFKSALRIIGEFRQKLSEYREEKEVLDGLRAAQQKLVGEYTEKAEQGDAGARVTLGEMYLHGDGVKKNVPLAVSLFQKAAEQGDPAAQNSLGVVYFRGVGVPRDYAKAHKWFGMAAEQGYVKAQANLAFMFEMGIGVARNYAESVNWYRKAAEKGQREKSDQPWVAVFRGKRRTPGYGRSGQMAQESGRNEECQSPVLARVNLCRPEVRVLRPSDSAQLVQGGCARR